MSEAEAVTQTDGVARNEPRPRGRKRRVAAWLAVASAGVMMCLLLPGLAPIMEVRDGCACGRERRWWETPDSPLWRVGWFRHVVREGDPACAHRYWDAQWGVWWNWPWAK